MTQKLRPRKSDFQVIVERTIRLQMSTEDCETMLNWKKYVVFAAWLLV